MKLTKEVKHMITSLILTLPIIVFFIYVSDNWYQVVMFICIYTISNLFTFFLKNIINATHKEDEETSKQSNKPCPWNGVNKL